MFHTGGHRPNGVQDVGREHHDGALLFELPGQLAVLDPVAGRVLHQHQANIKASSTLALGSYPLKVEVREGGVPVASRQVTVTIIK